MRTLPRPADTESPHCCPQCGAGFFRRPNRGCPDPEFWHGVSHPVPLTPADVVVCPWPGLASPSTGRMGFAVFRTCPERHELVLTNW